ncbi:MAG: ROK family protein [Leptospirales bacterium]|nr:ROK family protein [Leptospirales bacterium]
MQTAQAAYLGIDLGGSNIYGVAFSPDFQPLADAKCDTEARQGYEHVLERIRSQIELLLTASREQGYVPAAIGLCVPGVIEMEQDTVRTAPNLSWSEVRPLEQLALPLPGRLINDVNAGLLGELDAMQTKPSIAAAYFCGTGIGGAIWIHGRLLTGAHGGAGEAGHCVVRVGGRRPEGGIRGSLEAYIGKWALNRRIQARLESGKKTMLRELIDYNLNKTPVKSSSLKKAYEAGDRYTRELMEDYYARYLGVGISQCVNLIEPEMVVLGGGIMESLGRRLLPSIERHMRRHSLTSAPELRLAALGDLAGPRGAAVYARQLAETAQDVRQ